MTHYYKKIDEKGNFRGGVTASDCEQPLTKQIVKKTGKKTGKKTITFRKEISEDEFNLLNKQIEEDIRKRANKIREEKKARKREALSKIKGLSSKDIEILLN